MTRSELLAILADSPLIASVQASTGPLEPPAALLPLAKASVQEGVRFLRLQGLEAIALIRSAAGVPTIGLVKREYADSRVYITPTLAEVDVLIEAGCEVIALDGTMRYRPGDAQLSDLVRRIHEAGRLAMADCDTLASAMASARAGVDLIGTTLAGYTEESSMIPPGPAISLVREIRARTDIPVIAEGRYAQPWEVSAARRAGACAVVVGGALNDPIKQTRVFSAAAANPHESVMAVDIGGTWLRAARFDTNWQMIDLEKVELPQERDARTHWIREVAEKWNVRRIGIGTGGTVAPGTTRVVEAKPIIPNHVGTNFAAALPDHKVVALNDGLATAWGHACHADFAGIRVVTLALGTGVGCGVVDRGKILMGPQGGYPRLNDLALPDGSTFEDALGGAALTPNPSAEQRQRAQAACDTALQIVRTIYYPEAIVVCGGVGLSDWLELDAARTPFGPHAGLYGAAALALYPGWRD
ncbi:MAG: putative N-acetylmannosamine-6-phosphate 2-epimerase [Chthonomonas sp.]|nr:putative N-acetylmannosamine-6-phosphate 2-epimerase [Chthonomonas sp.]